MTAATDKVHVKTAFRQLELRELLQSSPEVLLGVSAGMVTTLASVDILTVYDLALGGLFRDAARVVEAAADPGSTLAQHGVPPSDLIVPVTAGALLADLPGEPVEALVAVTPATALALQSTMGVKSVRDLAQWPPYLAAVKLLASAFDPEKAAGYDRDEPPDLVARTGDVAAHRVRYTSTVLIESKPSQKYQWDGGLIDVTSLSPVGFNDVAFGATLRYSQSWTPRAVALGQLLHSLPLAPGESTRLTVVDWLRRVAASTEEEQTQSERLTSALSNSTAISEVTRAVAREFQSGDSVAASTSMTTSASTPGLVSLIGVQGSAGATFGAATTYSTSYGSRAVSASALQSIDARSQQNSALARTKRAAIVSEVRESESESINTRMVVNQNHMHSLSVQYFEVVQTWETVTRLDAVERCIFIPMKLVNLANEQVLRRYLPILVDAALDRQTRDLLLRLRHTVVLQFPFDRFAAAALDVVRAELGTAVDGTTGDGQVVVRLPFGLAASVEKRLRLQQLESQVGELRGAIRAEGDAAVHSRLVEGYDPAGLARYEIDREALVRGVAWDPAQVAKVTLQLADGTTLEVAEPLSRAPSEDPPEQAGLGAGVPIVRLRTLGASVTAASGINPSDHELVRLWLLVELRGRRMWLDMSFITSRSRATDVTVLENHAPIDVEALTSRLMAAQLHYSQAIWMRADRHALLMQLAPYVCEIAGTTIRVVEWMDPVPVSVAGNYVAFPFTYEADDEWKSWKARELDASLPKVSLVPLPTGGVFAEAVLGEFNSAEKLDATRFWKWQESPIPHLAPEIAPVAAGEHTRIGAPVPGGLPQPGIGLQQPLALPALGGSEALLKTLMVSKLFNDMSGIDITKGLLKASIEASRDGNLAVAKQANDTLKAITDSFGKLLSAGTDGGENLTKTMKGLGSLFNLAGSGDGKTPGSTPKSGAAGSAVEAGTTGTGPELGDFVAGDGAEAIAAIGGEIGPILEAIGPLAAALLV